MHFNILVLFTLVSFVRNHDVSIGIDGGRKIFEDTRYASPAIWRQIENVTVIAPSNEVISKVNITDLRVDKDGDVRIVDGGDGEKSVTIELKSPTVLRGYEFHIEVFSVMTKSENDNAQTDVPEVLLNNEYKTTEVPEGSDSESSNIPISVAKDSDVARPARGTNDTPQTSLESDSTETVNDENTTTESSVTVDTENNDLTTEIIEGSGSDIDSDLLRPARHASENKISTESEATVTTTEMEEFEIMGTRDYIPETTTELPIESSSEDIPALIAKNEGERPARETDDENEPQVTIEDAKDLTTESSLINSNENTMDYSDYSNIGILEYIKRREQSGRKMRRTDDEEQSDPSESQEEDTTSEVPSNDDTVDLVPPDADASYNDDFSSETTETPSESLQTASSSNLRPVRRLELPLEFYTTFSDQTTADDTTEESTTLAEGSTTESSLEEKSRNSRNTENLENSEDFDFTNETGVEQNIISSDKISSGVVLLHGDEVIISADGKQVRFNLPIVLIIANENNFPLFRLVEPQVIEEKDLNVEPEPVLDENVQEYTSANEEAAREVVNNFVVNDETH